MEHLTNENVAKHISRTAKSICEQKPYEISYFVVPRSVIKRMKEFLCRLDYYDNRRIKRTVLNRIKRKRI